MKILIFKRNQKFELKQMGREKVLLTSQSDPPTSKSNSASQRYSLGEVTLSDEPILQTINLVLQTAFLKSAHKPISLLLIGEPGLGKSRLLSPLRDLPYVRYLNDLTPKYLVEFLEQVKKGEKKFLAIPDFTNCISHGKSTRETLTAILRSMTEEGVNDLSDYHLEFKSDRPVRAGLITATTKSSHGEFSQSWKKTGFLSRLLPFSFSHSPETTQRIMDEIDSKKEETIDQVRFKVNQRPPEITYDSNYLVQLRACEQLLANQTGSAPYRQQIQLTKLAESSAILERRYFDKSGGHQHYSSFVSMDKLRL